MTERAALYLRVSTVKQAEKELSIPDQKRQCEAYCRTKGWTIAASYVEPGASATDDRRPHFQRMIEDAAIPDRPFTVILVHSFSRFFRDAFQLEFYVRKLAKLGVRLVSLTQDTNDSDPMGPMIRQMMALFDEYQSRENGKHTLRGMKENARQGFWNGAPPPFGYRTVEAERRADKVKRRLEIDPGESDLVRKIFDLYRNGDGRSGPMGIKAITSYLNGNGLRMRSGSQFAIKTVHEILTRTTYIGRHYFNKTNSKTQQPKPVSEWVEVAVPVLIEPAIFGEVQARLAARNPKNTPPRVVGSPVLLTGLAKCGSCGGGMTLRTGKSGAYRYYTCSTCARQGKTACKGRSVPMRFLDDLILDQLAARLFIPEHMEELLRDVLSKTATDQSRLEGDIKGLRRELRDSEQRLERLFDAIETGTLVSSDSMRNRQATLEQRRQELIRLIAMAQRQLDMPRHVISPKKIAAFTAAVQDKLRNGDVAFRKAYLRLFIDRIEVDDAEVRIMGSKAALVKAIGSDEPPEGSVPSFMGEWRPQGDSNPCYRRERAMS
jgi:site-specific DNA recombinase